MATTKQILGKVVITNRGEYNSSTVYEILDVVSYQGSSYLSKVYDNDSLPTDDTKWQLLAQKGDTYEVSESDIENIANKITENANSNFNRNVSEKTETFNSNAKTKTDEFNSNANNTVSAYNVNAENKLKEYNENDTVKLKKYNDNATSSVDNYNSNAGTKLNEYNTNSVNKLKEYNDNASQKINEYNEHSKELNEKADSTRKELDRVKNEILDQGEAKGDFIHLEDSAMAELQELSIDGVLKQETTKGLNCLNTNNLKTITNNGITYTPVYNKNGILKYVNVNGTATDNSAYTVHEGTRYSVDKDKSYLVSGCPIGGSSSTYSVLTYCYDENNTYFSGVYDNGSGAVVSQATFVWLNIDVKKGVTLNNAKFYPMLSEGTEKVEYEPYTSLLPSPSPDYKQPIEVLANNLKVVSCNENLVNLFAEVLHNVSYNLTTGINLKEQKSNVNGSHIVSKNRLTINVPQAWGYYADYIIPVKPNTKYYVSVDNISTNGLKFSDYVLDEDFNIIGVWYISQNNISNHSITTSAKAKYICLGFSSGVANSTIILENLQLKEENSAEFKNHQESSLTFDIPEGEFAGYIDDNYKDELAVVYNETDGHFHKMLKKKVGKIVFDGSENGWWLHTSGGFAKLVRNSKYGSVKCTNFTSKLFTEDKTIYAYSDGYIKIRYDKFTTVDEFKNWLSTNNTEVYYRLAEPYEIDLGVCDMPFSYDKVTNIFTDNEFSPNISAKYYRNFTKTIQNLQINKKELKQELIEINSRLSTLEAANNTAVSNSIQIEEGEVSE